MKKYCWLFLTIALTSCYTYKVTPFTKNECSKDECSKLFYEDADPWYYLDDLIIDDQPVQLTKKQKVFSLCPGKHTFYVTDSYSVSLANEYNFRGQIRQGSPSTYTFVKIDTVEFEFEKGKTYSMTSKSFSDRSKKFSSDREAESYFNSTREFMIKEYKPRMTEGGRIIAIVVSTSAILVLIVGIAFASI